jgi:hypothetical protein
VTFWNIYPCQVFTTVHKSQTLAAFNTVAKRNSKGSQTDCR